MDVNGGNFPGLPTSLLALVTIFLIGSPVLGHQAPFPVQHLSKPEERLKDLAQQGKALYEAGRLAEAQFVLQRVSQEYQALGDTLRQAMTLSNLALVYQQRGMFAEAVEAIDESLQLLGAHSKQNLQVLAQTQEIQGSLQLEQGQAEQGLKTWQRAEKIYAQMKDKSGITRSRINQAQALQVLGFYSRASKMLTELSDNLQSQPDSLTKVVELRSLGDTLQLMGKLDDSREALQKSLEIAQKLKSAQEISATLLSLANTAKIRQDYQAAIAFYQQVIATTPSPLTKVQAQINLLNVLLSTQQLSDVQSLLAQIQTELDRLPLSQVAVYARVQLAQSMLKLPSVATDAAKILATAVKGAQALGDRRAESHALGTLGKLYEQDKQWLNAQKLTQQALVLAQAVNAPDIAYNWHWQMGRLLKQQGNMTGAIAAYDAAVDELQSLRSDLVAVNRDAQFSFRESVEPVYRESVALLLQSQGELSKETLEKARQRMESLQLAELDNFFRQACLNVTKVVLDDVVDKDSPTTAIIYPIILQDKLQVIVKVPQQRLRHFSVNKSQKEVENISKQLREYLNEPDRTEEVKFLSKQVYNWLIQPIESELQSSNVNTLVFVLVDGALRSVPMASLYDGKQYLVEKYAVALNLGLQLQKPKPLAQEKLQVLAGGLVQPPPSYPQFSSLPEIKSEFNLITQAGIPTTKLLDQEFTQEALSKKMNASRFNIVHLATHGQFSSRPEDTFILDANGPINVTNFDLLLRRRNETRPEAIELLVLSACQTAAGDNRATLGLAGVAVQAGARSTLASLWKVDDKATAILMGEFYRELNSAKVTKAEALRRAQVTLLQKYPNYTRPGYWAAYVLVGNWL